MNEEPLYLGWAITWVCTCLFGFIASLNWPHECVYPACQHKKEGGKK